MVQFVARCRLTLHDNLYFASRELGRFYETEKYLHNYALTYALGLVKPAPAYFNNNQVPRYQEELTASRTGGFYVTPARPLQVGFAFVTFKMATVPYYAFTPQITQNRVVFGRAKELTPGSTFEFFVFGDKKLDLPKWIRLGKWMAKAELFFKWYELEKARIFQATTPQTVDCVINPLDFNRKGLYAFDVVPMPPVSLLVNPTVTGACYHLQSDKDFGDREKEQLFLPLEMGYFGGDL
jgi:CRISPR-associated protein Csc1